MTSIAKFALRIPSAGLLLAILGPNLLSSAPARPFFGRCEAVAHYNGPTQDPEWTLVCIDPCTQGCEETDPVQLGPGTTGVSCSCYGGGFQPTCCALYLAWVDEEPFGPVASGDCGEPACPAGDFCALEELDPETTGASCQSD